LQPNKPKSPIGFRPFKILDSKKDNYKMLNERPRIESPEELAEIIDILLDLYEYDKTNFNKRVFLGIFDHKGTADELLHKCKTEARKNAVLLIDQESLFPPLPNTRLDPLDDLREIQHWCIMASRAKPEKPAATQPLDDGTQGKGNPIAEIRIKKTDFNNGKSKTLLMDLAKQPDCVWYNEKLHGKKQPGTLKEMLKRNGKYDAIIDKIHQDQKDSQLKIYLEKDIRIILT
jgi:hypothetical protein